MHPFAIAAITFAVPALVLALSVAGPLAACLINRLRRYNAGRRPGHGSLTAHGHGRHRHEP